MKTLKTLFILQILLLSSALSQSIKFTDPAENAVLSNTDVTVKANIIPTVADTVWESIQFKIDKGEWQTYSNNDSTGTISFQYQDTYSDDIKHTFTIKAKISEEDSVTDSLHFTISTPAKIKESTLSPALLSPLSPTLNIKLIYNKKMNISVIPEFDFFENTTKQYTLSGAGAWQNDTTFQVQDETVVQNISGFDGRLTIKVRNSENSFGTVSEPSKIAQTLAVDTKSPEVTSVSPTPDRKIHIESAGNLSLTIKFDSPMDTTEASVGEVTLFEGSTEVPFNKNGIWKDNKTYTVQNGAEVGTAFSDGITAKVRVEDFKDENQNTLKKDESFTAFTFDHTKPTVTSVETSNPVIHEAAAHSVIFTLHFSEAMDTSPGHYPLVTLVKDDTTQINCGDYHWVDKTTLTVSNSMPIDNIFAAHGVKLKLVVKNSYDVAGNIMDEYTKTDIITMDHHAPELVDVQTFRTYVNRQTFAEIKLDLTFDEPSMDDISVYCNGEEIQSETKNKGEKTVSVFIKETLPDSIPNGDTLLVQFSGFKDTYGNIKTSKTKKYSVAVLDTIKPSSPHINQHAGATNKIDEYPFTGSKYDDNGLVGIFFEDKEVVDVVDTGRNWVYSLNISGLGDGGNELGKKYTFHLYAQDEAGNKSETVTTDLIIDRTGPQSAQISNTLLGNKYINKSTVSFDLKNTSSEKAIFYFTENNSPNPQWINSGKFFMPNDSVLALRKTFNDADGSRTLELFAEDTLGNVSSSALLTYTFKLDRKAPEVTDVEVNNKKTGSASWFIWGPSQGSQVQLKLFIKEEIAGISDSAIPNISLLSKADTINIPASGSWDGKSYTVKFNLDAPDDGSIDDRYDIQISGIKDKAGNQQKTEKRFYFQIDTQKPEIPIVTSPDKQEIIERNNVVTFSGTKNDSDATRIIIKESQTTGLFDSTDFSYKASWDLNILFDKSREYNFTIMTQDQALNISDSIHFKVLIDWMPPVLSAETPYLDIQLDNKIETGKLKLIFSEKLSKIVFPRDSMVVYPKGMFEKRVSAKNLNINGELFTADFSAESIDKIGEWLKHRYTPVFRLAAGTVVDVAGNGNLPLINVPFIINAPSIIKSLSDSLLFFSPNDDGLTDVIELNVEFNTTDDKYINLNIYRPDIGSVFSLYGYKLSLGKYENTKSGIQLIPKENTQKVTLRWDGTNAKTHQKVPEGAYYVRVSATNNPAYTIQIPKVAKVIADTTKPLIQRITPAFGDDVLTLRIGSVIKVYPTEPIFMKSENGSADWQYLEGKLAILQDSVDTPQTESMKAQRAGSDSLGDGNYFYFEVDSGMVNKYQGETVELQFIVNDGAQQKDTVEARVRFQKETGKVLDYFVNYPNPFNPDVEGTTFQFTKGDANNFTLRVFDVSGELVAFDSFSTSNISGNYVNIPWKGKGLSGRPLPNGVYYAVITSGKEKSKVVKMLIYRK